MMRLIILGLIAALVVPAAVAAQTGVDFRGLPLRASEAEFKRANPGFACQSTGDQSSTLGDRVCTVRGEWDPRGAVASFGGVPAIYIAAYFVHDRFFMLLASFKSDHFDAIAAALQEKYGKPGSVDTPPITTRAGLRATNTIMLWTLGQDTVTAVHYSNTIAEGSVMYRDSSIADEMESRARDQVKAGAKSL
jgi:hypothetical protein